MSEKQGLYQLIKNNIEKETCMLCTVLDQDLPAEKMFFCGHEKLWSTKTSALLAPIEKELLDVSESGIIDTGSAKVFCECFGGRGRLVICGAGHVSIPIIQTGKRIGYHVTVLEDRHMFADHARRAGADQVICDDFAHGMEQIPGGNNTYFVIVTRGHRYDVVCLEQALKKKNAYIGMMGSCRRVGIIKERLIEKGVESGLLERLHAPIGLPIHAETPEEIAVSIMAEIIQVKNSHKRTAGYADVLDALLEQEQGKDRCILATIVSRKGSAPRAVGTKMLIWPDGRTTGTIGGGCMENEVIQKARMMLKEIGPRRQLIKIDMTGRQAEEWGMICGGKITVYLEYLKNP